MVILGPTGAGKSHLALSLAEAFGGEIVNCDSVQVYRGLDIGSAKTPVERRRGIAHHLLDVVGPGEELTAGSYARMARATVRDIQARGRLPIVAGGTGFYLRALLDGLSPAPSRNESLRLRLQGMSDRRSGSLHRVLRRFDPPAAARIHPNDTPKLVRAIEIMLLSGTVVTHAQSAPRDTFKGVRSLKLGLDPDRRQLYCRLNERAAWMFHNGLIEETQALLQGGYDSGSKPMQSLGYKQAVQVIGRQMTVDAAISECQIRTRQYAKRQMTWFRTEQNVDWLPGFGWTADILDAANRKVAAFLYD